MLKLICKKYFILKEITMDESIIELPEMEFPVRVKT